MIVKIKILNNKISLPEYKSAMAAGVDLQASISEQITISPLERVIVPTGIQISLPSGYEAQIRPRSGLAAKYGLTVLNSPGTIDADYRGEIKVILVNVSNTDITIQPFDRIAQMVFAKHEYAQFCVGDLDETQRGSSGFGSTGV